MDFNVLDLQIINNIIMYQRPTYPYIKELQYFSGWFEGESDRIVGITISSWILDAIELRNYFKKEFLYNEHIMLRKYLFQFDIAGNTIEFSEEFSI
jgi:hypothetical protein|tara:strand:+ start:746 stop:1033 length:288 start_codon:yes stop_codon:yes gene_type:complete